MAESRRAVLCILPEWGSAKGGQYSVCKSLVKKLIARGQQVDLVLGTTKKEMTEDDHKEIDQMGITKWYGPDPELYENDEPTQPPLQRLQNNIDEYFNKVNKEMAKYKIVFAFSPETHSAGKYFLQGFKASNCKLVLYNFADDTVDDENVFHILECARGSKGLFSIGWRIFRKWNTEIKVDADQQYLRSIHSLFFPDMSNFFSVSETKPSEHDQVIFFAPLSGSADKSSFHRNCINAVDSLNNIWKSANQADKKVTLIIQKDSMDSYSGSTNTKFRNYTTHDEIAKIARACTLVIADGNFTASGFSGLEFLMQGIPTFVIEGSDVAELIEEVDPSLSSTLVLTKTRPEDATSQDHCWTQNLVRTIQSLKSLNHYREKVKDLACKISDDGSIQKSNMKLDELLEGNGIY